MSEQNRKRRLSRELDDLPGLFDDIDISRPDIAGDIIAAHLRRTRHETGIPSIPEEDLKPRPSMKFISFGSGSSGNCAYVGTDSTGVLIDAGVDNEYVVAELLRNGINMASVKGIILTHDHGDHVKFVYSLLRRNKSMRVYCTPRTLGGILRRHSISRRIKDYHTPIYKEFAFKIGDMTITPFEVSHDGTDNVGFAIESAAMKFVITTDTGRITDRADYYMREADALMIESNYDLDMLREGRYPEYLKARIMSDTGHLDNAVTAAYLAGIATQRLSHVFLCHLSHDNNSPEVAIGAVTRALESAGITISEDALKPGLHLVALPRFASSRLYILHPC